MREVIVEARDEGVKGYEVIRDSSEVITSAKFIDVSLITMDGLPIRIN
jgi:hypothetical protein